MVKQRPHMASFASVHAPPAGPAGAGRKVPGHAAKTSNGFPLPAGESGGLSAPLRTPPIPPRATRRQISGIGAAAVAK